MDDLKLYASSEEDLRVLLDTVERYSSNIGMHFGVEKCATLLVKKRKRVSSAMLCYRMGRG